MNRSLVKFLRPLIPSLTRAIGQQRYRALRARLMRSHRYDEVYLVWHALGNARANTGTMLDVGGHRGESSEPFAECGWRVHCFEPNPENWPIIRSRLTERFPRTKLYPVAVGESQEVGRLLYTSPESSGITSLHSFHTSHSPSVSVDVVTLADHCANENITQIDFLKIDTEGFDYLVLRGLNWSIVPDVIVCEFEDSKTEALGYDYKDMAEYLVERGYRVVVSEWKAIQRYGIDHEWLRYSDFPCSLADPKGWGNLIAVRDSATEKQLLRHLEALSPGALAGPRVDR